ncbi:hypothetical protein CHARACLAT_032903 [Characodon lateralis]|uniref:Uncharacterized protein n=1 Tax=Characodon lateralis TaxID=208331 RepID=A0ABU7DQR5_9TELE|nr:hypothetical protein [Characodon lateralis]
MMESNSIMNSADVEMQKVVVADLIHLSPVTDCASDDSENAAKLELSKAEERMEKAEAKLVDLKADELKKASSQRGEQAPTFQVPDLHFHSQQPQQGTDSDSRHRAPRSESSLPKFSQSVELTSTDLNRSVGSQMVSSGFLPNPISVNNHQDDQVPDSACTSGPVRWKEHRSGLIGTPLLFLTLCRSLGVKRGAHGSQVTQSNLTHHHLHESIH